MKGLKSTGFKLSSPPDFKWLETALFSIDPYNNFFKWTEASQVTVEIGVEYTISLQDFKMLWS